MPNVHARRRTEPLQKMDLVAKYKGAMTLFAFASGKCANLKQVIRSPKPVAQPDFMGRVRYPPVQRLAARVELVAVAQT